MFMYYTHAYQLLKNILMTGNQRILSQHLNIRVNSYFTFLFINQRVLKWSISIYDLTSYLIYPTDKIYYLKFIILFFIIGYYTHRYQLLTNILMTGHQCIQGHHFNIRESSYFKLLFINQQAPKWILWLFTVGQNIKFAWNV